MTSKNNFWYYCNYKSPDLHWLQRHQVTIQFFKISGVVTIIPLGGKRQSDTVLQPLIGAQRGLLQVNNVESSEQSLEKYFYKQLLGESIK